MRLSAPFTTLAAFVYAASAQTITTPSSTSGALTGLKYTSVGGSGSYSQVTNMLPGDFPVCDANPSCIQSTVSVSGNLAPFNDEMTFNFRGPLNLYNIAVYQPDAAGDTWNLASSWASNQTPNNLVFMNNLGGDGSGVWTICGGNSQSYASGDFTAAVATPNAQLSSGAIAGNVEMNIMTAEACSDSSPCNGYYRGTANHGWAGSKMLLVTFEMPTSADASEVPAIWSLNAQVVRSAQYGCNCRGEGSPGGCGELDLIEVIVNEDSTHGVSEIYSFKGATGSGTNNWFTRPTGGPATYAVIFDEQTDSIAIQEFNSWDYSTSSVPRASIDSYLNAPALQVSFATGARKRYGGW